MTRRILRLKGCRTSSSSDTSQGGSTADSGRHDVGDDDEHLAASSTSKTVPMRDDDVISPAIDDDDETEVEGGEEEESEVEGGEVEGGQVEGGEEEESEEEVGEAEGGEVEGSEVEGGEDEESVEEGAEVEGGEEEVQEMEVGEEEGGEEDGSEEKVAEVEGAEVEGSEVEGGEEEVGEVEGGEEVSEVEGGEEEVGEVEGGSEEEVAEVERGEDEGREIEGGEEEESVEEGAEVEGGDEEESDDDRKDGDDVGLTVRQTTSISDMPNSFTFNVPYADMKRFVGGKSSRGLVDGWSAFMYKQFNAVYPFCALAFYYNHCRQLSSQKLHSPFWVGRARCRTGNCIEATMVIQDYPVADEDVRVDVEVTGVCQHVEDGQEIVVERPNRRQLRSQQRAETAEQLTTSQQSATELYYRRLGEMSTLEVDAGNQTTCQTPPVLRQAAYERRRSEHLHEHLVMELDIARECWEASTPGIHINGYVQQLGIFPFHVLFFTEAQVAAYVDQCKTGPGATVHIDATGSVVRRIPGQKTVYYYCVLLSDGNLPILDMLTSKHEAAWIQCLFQSYNSAVRRVNNGRLVTPRFIVTDFSYALMHACIQAFNDGMQLDTYLQQTYNILSGRCTLAQMRNVTFLSLCAAHMLKAMSMRLSKAVPNKNCRALTMLYYAALQRTTDLQAAAWTYRDIALVLCSRRETSAVANARLQLEARVSGLDVTAADDKQHRPPPIDDDATSTVDVGTLKSRSPFTTYFESMVGDITSSNTDTADDATTDNNTYCLQAFAQVINVYSFCNTSHNSRPAVVDLSPLTSIDICQNKQIFDIVIVNITTPTFGVHVVKKKYSTSPTSPQNL